MVYCGRYLRAGEAAVVAGVTARVYGNPTSHHPIRSAGDLGQCDRAVSSGGAEPLTAAAAAPAAPGPRAWQGSVGSEPAARPGVAGPAASHLTRAASQAMAPRWRGQPARHGGLVSGASVPPEQPAMAARAGRPKSLEGGVGPICYHEMLLGS